MQKVYEYGVGSRSRSLSSLDSDIFDQKMLDKLLLLYSPQRTQGKVVFDCVDMHDGELLINSGVVHSPAKECMAKSGGLTSLLPLMEAITAVTEKRIQLALALPDEPEEENVVDQDQSAGQDVNELLNTSPRDRTRPTERNPSKSASLVNEFLRLTIAIVSTAENQNDSNYAEFNSFFRIMFHHFDKLPVTGYRKESSSTYSQRQFALQDA
jgi:hypothetical protein